MSSIIIMVKLDFDYSSTYSYSKLLQNADYVQSTFQTLNAEHIDQRNPIYQTYNINNIKIPDMIV